MSVYILIVCFVVYVVMARLEYNKVANRVYVKHYRSEVKPLHNKTKRDQVHIQAVAVARKEAAAAAVSWPIRLIERFFTVVFKRSDMRYLKMREKLDETIGSSETLSALKKATD